MSATVVCQGAKCGRRIAPGTDRSDIWADMWEATDPAGDRRTWVCLGCACKLVDAGWTCVVRMETR
jgi:hypothetical protein